VYFLSRTQVISAIGAVFLALYVLDLVRRRRLSEEYSLLWVASTAVIAILGFSTPVLVWITQLFGLFGAGSTVYTFGLTFAVAMLLYLSIKLSRLGSENHALVRDLALLRYELESMKLRRGAEGEAK
jgi:hypothetical protein